MMKAAVAAMATVATGVAAQTKMGLAMVVRLDQAAGQESQGLAW